MITKDCIGLKRIAKDCIWSHHFAIWLQTLDFHGWISAILKPSIVVCEITVFGPRKFRASFLLYHNKNSQLQLWFCEDEMHYWCSLIFNSLLTQTRKIFEVPPKNIAVFYTLPLWCWAYLGFFTGEKMRVQWSDRHK